MTTEQKEAIDNLEKLSEYGLCYTINEKIIEDIETVLNLITKLQKENEDLLREKEENKFIIAMANNEMLGYILGYSDAKNQTSNATEIVVKNRQAYMHKEEVEFYIKKIDFYKKENKTLKEKIKEKDKIII